MWTDGSPIALIQMFKVNLICSGYLRPECSAPMDISGLGDNAKLLKMSSCSGFRGFLDAYQSSCGSPTTQVYKNYYLKSAGQVSFFSKTGNKSVTTIQIGVPQGDAGFEENFKKYLKEPVKETAEDVVVCSA